MIIPCVSCGRAACDATPPQLGKGESFALSKMLGAFTDNAGGLLALVVNPDAATVAREFNVLCVECTHG